MSYSANYNWCDCWGFSNLCWSNCVKYTWFELQKYFDLKVKIDYLNNYFLVYECFHCWKMIDYRLIEESDNNLWYDDLVSKYFDTNIIKK